LTLIEIMVVLAIVGLLAGVLIYGYRRIPATVLRRDATRLAAILHSAYDRASATGAHHRVLFDLDKGEYKVERCEGKVELRKDIDQKDEEDRKRQEDEKRKLMEQSQTPPMQMLQSVLADTGTKVGQTANCEPVRGEMGAVQALTRSPEVRIARIYVRHYEHPADKGQVVVHFFPMGRAERSVVELAIGDEVLSVGVHPLSGRVQIVDGVWPHPDEFVSADAEGRKQ
jgi:Tfp pilus assembly protein PilE